MSPSDRGNILELEGVHGSMPISEDGYMIE